MSKEFNPMADMNEEDQAAIMKISERFVIEAPQDFPLSLRINKAAEVGSLIACVHAKICPLDLQKMVKAPLIDLMTWTLEVIDHIDLTQPPEEAKFDDEGYVPRFALSGAPNETELEITLASIREISPELADALDSIGNKSFGGGIKKPDYIKALGQEQEDALIILGRRFISYGEHAGVKKGKAIETASKASVILTVINNEIIKLDFVRWSSMPILELMEELKRVIENTDISEGLMSPKFIDPDFKPRFVLEPV